MQPVGPGALALRQWLRDRTTTCVAEVTALITRTQEHAGLNGYVEFDAQGLLEQAGAADLRIAAGEDLPLLGVPIALKDNIDASGFASAAGTPALQGRHPRHEAEIVLRLRAAGALIAGKTTMHELAFGITTNNAFTGAARNPWNPALSAGGSSGGSGVVVAAGLVPAAIGTDTGGSIRVPSALCGLVGWRPSVGRVPGHGIAPISTTRDTAGPMARHVADCRLIDGVLSGDHSAPQAVALPGLRIGLPRERFWEDLEPGVQDACTEALERLRAAGVEFVELTLPGLDEANAIASFPISFYEFVRDMRSYLRTAERGVDFETLVTQIRSPDVAAILQPLLGAGAVTPQAYREALAARARLQQIYAQAFASHGLAALMFPTVPLTARPLGQDDTVMNNGRQVPTFHTFIRNTEPGTNAGIPGITLPAGFSGGMPVGLAMDGPSGSDRQLLAMAAAVEHQMAKLASP